MHLGYHELRKTLDKFKEEAEKRRLTAPPSSNGFSAGRPGDRDRDRDRDREHRSRDDYRERDRERHSSRYE